MIAVNPLIHSLIYNNNALSSETLEEWLNSGQIKESEVRTVLPAEMVDDFKHAPRAQRVGAGVKRLPESSSDDFFTEVYFWGMRYSGKSTVIASVLASQPQSIEMLNTDDGKERAKQQVDIFGQEGKLIHFPNDGGDQTNTPNVTRVDLRANNGKGFRSYPVALIECIAGKNFIDIENTLYHNSQRDQIHILCWDPTCQRQDDQERIFCNLLMKLKGKGVLDRTVGIYLMVTKVDTFNIIPEDSARKQIAQQTIISEHSLLWSIVRNFSYDVGVYGVKPIPFSIGDVFLQKLVKVNLHSSRSLIENQLLLKCQPIPTLFERALSHGSLGLTILLVLAFCTGIGYSAWQSFSNISTPPQSEVTPFDYETFFLDQEKKLIQGKKFDNCYWQFVKLDKDLTTEMFVRERESNDNFFTQGLLCEQTLYNDYAKSLHTRNLEEFKKPHWGTHEYLLKRTNEVLPNKTLYRDVKSDLMNDTATIHNSMRARNVITFSSSSKYCPTLQSVESLINDAKRYQKVPIINDTTVLKGLNHVPYEAFNSYVRAINRNVNARLHDRSMCEAYRDTLKQLKKRSDVDQEIKQKIDKTLERIESRYPSSGFSFRFW